MDFTNFQIEIERLPQIERITYIPVEEKYKKWMYIQFAIAWLVPTILVAVAAVWVPEYRWIMIGGAVFLLFCCIVQLALVGKIYRYKGYALREKDIMQKRGVIFHKHSTVPFTRIQHISVEQGIIARTLDLATLQIFTATGDENDLKIIGLSNTRAHEIKQFILEILKKDETP